MDCLRCQVPMNPVQVGDHRATLCPQCDGVWFDKNALEAFLDKGAATLAASPLAPTLVADHEGIDLERRLACPSCGNQLHRYNFCGDSGIILDACEFHGVWFDDGELSRLLDYVHRCDQWLGDLGGEPVHPADSFFTKVVNWLSGRK